MFTMESKSVVVLPPRSQLPVNQPVWCWDPKHLAPCLLHLERVSVFCRPPLMFEFSSVSAPAHTAPHDRIVLPPQIHINSDDQSYQIVDAARCHSEVLLCKLRPLESGLPITFPQTHSLPFHVAVGWESPPA